MKIDTKKLGGLLGVVGMCAGVSLNCRDEDYSQIEALVQQAQQVAKDQLASGETNGGSGGCTLENLRIRREWSTLAKDDRKAFTNTMLCLGSKPTRTPATFAAGAKTRWDDWTATHIAQTPTIHFTGNFLSWHRWFTFLMEKALGDECGYTGPMPYWDWAQTAVTGLKNHPLFDGSEYSISGDGEYAEQIGDIILSQPTLPNVTLPTADGGGCIASGPFKGWMVDMGPHQLSLPGGEIQMAPSGNSLDYNPRCVKRDLTDYVIKRFANATSVLRNLREKTIGDFQARMQGNIDHSGDIGIHGGPHYGIGGDPGRDVGVSPSDPAFFLHHSGIDRVWWTWQMQDPESRVYGDNAINGTGTFLNFPPSPEQTLDDTISMEYITDQVVTIRDLMSTTAGPFCYIYL